MEFILGAEFGKIAVKENNLKKFFYAFEGNLSV